MAFVYSCDCGYVARGENAAEFVADVRGTSSTRTPTWSASSIVTTSSRSRRRRSLRASTPSFRQTIGKSASLGSRHAHTGYDLIVVGGGAAGCVLAAR